MRGMNPITTMKLFDAVAIAKNANTTSVAIDLRNITPNGKFSVHYIMAGTGTMKLEYLMCATEDGTYLEPSNASDIVAAASAGSDILTLEPELSPFMKIKATENNVNPITSLTLWINIQ